MTSTIIYHHTPYVYVIRHIPSGKFYAGSRTAKGCHPSDLWTKYFTSSKYVKDLINADGLESFKVLCVLECNDWSSALNLETTILKSVNAAKSCSWLNMTNADGKFNTILYTRSKECEAKRSAKISAALKGKPKSEAHKVNMGAVRQGKKQRPNSPESNARLSAALKGKPKSEAHKLSMSIATKNHQKKTCHHCNRIFSPGNFTRFHGDKCKLALNEIAEI